MWNRIPVGSVDNNGSAHKEKRLNKNEAQKRLTEQAEGCSDTLNQRSCVARREAH